MTLDPRAARVLELVAKGERPKLWTLDGQAARARFDQMVPILDAKDRPIWPSARGLS